MTGAGKMLKQAIDVTCEIAQGNFVNRGVDTLFDSLSGNHNFDSDLKNMESNFISLMARAIDLEKDVSTKVEQGRRRRKREVEVWFEDVKKVEEEYHTFVQEEERKGFVKKIFGGDEGIKLNSRIRYLDKRSRYFGELALADDSTSTRGLPRPATVLVGAAFQDNFQRICNLLEIDQVSSIGVYGMGGVGKSTLVEHIHNHLLQTNKCVFWVVVSSQRCSIMMLQDKIARKLCLDLSDDDADVGARAGRLNQALSQRKNFVFILDDVWEHIDLAKVGVPIFAEGCKWMVTSRSLKVCQEMKCQIEIGVKPLGEDEGWNLFIKNIGQDATSSIKDPEVEGIAKRMVEICDGLPLGIVTLVGAMSGVTGIEEWRHALGVLEESGMGHEWMEEKVFRVLKYSFDRLNPKDQRCFLYCSLYPEDYKISREDLFNKFISEKLVDEKKSRGAQRDEAHSIVTRLVKVSLLESVYDSMEDECVKMHDLVRGMAHKITEGKTMAYAGWKEIPIEEEWANDLEKVSLMMNGIDEIPLGISPNCPKLSTLLLRGNPLREGISTSFFSNLCGLHILDLSQTHIRELPDSVSDLMNLTSLLLGRCRKLVHVPCVRKLKELRELDLSETSIEDVPQGMEELRNIRLLSMDGVRKLRSTSLKLKLPCVQHLRIPSNIKAELVEGGERLEVFTGWLKHMSDFTRLAASKHDAVSYSVVVCDKGCSRKYFHNHSNGTRRLRISAYDLKGKEDNESTTISADYIQYLEFNSCEGMSNCLLDDLSNPASLKKLKIKNSERIECMLTYDQFKAPQVPKSRFQTLEEIVLRNLEDFIGVIHKLEVEVNLPRSSVFSSLRRLNISSCNKMKNLGLPLFVIEKLEHITIKDCKEIEEIVQVAAAIPDQPPSSAFSSLTKLTISGCKKMKKLGLPLFMFKKLEYISVCVCEEIEEIIQVGAADADAFLIPNLKSLILVGLSSLERFCDVPLICNLLEEFMLRDCPRLEVPFLNWGTAASYKPLLPGFDVEETRRQRL